MGFNFTSSQRQIKQLNPQIGFNVKFIQIQIQPLNTNGIQCQIYTKADSTIKP